MYGGNVVMLPFLDGSGLLAVLMGTDTRCR